MPSFDPEKWLRQRRVATLTPAVAGFPSLVEELTGQRVTGSWWAHPDSHVIYNTYQRLVAAESVLTLKLIDGKVTFVHEALWASLLSAVLDRNWRLAAEHGLKNMSRTLLELVESRGTLLCTRANLPFEHDARALRNARRELERRALLISGDEHTESGSHAPYLQSWGHFRESHGHKIGSLTGRDEALTKIRKWTGGARLTIDNSPRRSG